MQERRKHNRIPFQVTLMINSLFKQNNTKIDNLDAKIIVYDLSLRGLGFHSKVDLPIDFYFDAEIAFDQDKHFLTVLRIIRKEKEDQAYNYGCEFIGLADNLALSINEYAQIKK